VESLSTLEGLNALGHREVLLGPVLAHDEEAAGLLVLGVHSHLKVVEVSHLLLLLLVQLQQLFQELAIVARNLLAILNDVQNRPRLRLHLVDVEVELSGNLVGILGTLDVFLALVHLESLHLFLGKSEAVLDAELVVTALLLPELLELFALCCLKRERLILDSQLGRSKLINQLLLQPQL